jgi:hypothetical protein
MPDWPRLIVGVAAALALMGVGGGLYEFLVVDPFWPQKPELIQPARGGISRRRFWIPAHLLFELALLTALVSLWPRPEVRSWLLLGLVSHALMRIWSALDFIPRALTFERAELGAVTETEARAWARRSVLRLPLDLVTCAAMLAAFATAVRLPGAGGY